MIEGVGITIIDVLTSHKLQTPLVLNMGLSTDMNQFPKNMVRIQEFPHAEVLWPPDHNFIFFSLHAQIRLPVPYSIGRMGLRTATSHPLIENCILGIKSLPLLDNEIILEEAVGEKFRIKFRLRWIMDRTELSTEEWISQNRPLFLQPVDNSNLSIWTNESESPRHRNSKNKSDLSPPPPSEFSLQSTATGGEVSSREKSPQRTRIFAMDTDDLPPILGIFNQEDYLMYQKIVQHCWNYPASWTLGAATENTIYHHHFNPEENCVWVHSRLFLQDATLADCVQANNEVAQWPQWHATVNKIEQKGCETKFTKALHAYNSMAMGIIKSDMNLRIQRFIHDGILFETLQDEKTDGDAYVPPADGKRPLMRSKVENYAMYIPMDGGCLMCWHLCIRLEFFLPEWLTDFVIRRLVPQMVTNTIHITQRVRTDKHSKKLREEDTSGIYQLLQEEQLKIKPYFNNWKDPRPVIPILQKYNKIFYEQCCETVNNYHKEDKIERISSPS